MTRVGRWISWIIWATTIVLPEPVTPMRTWCFWPLSTPSASFLMASGWPPAAEKPAVKANLGMPQLYVVPFTSKPPPGPRVLLDQVPAVCIGFGAKASFGPAKELRHTAVAAVLQDGRHGRRPPTKATLKGPAGDRCRAATGWRPCDVRLDPRGQWPGPGRGPDPDPGSGHRPARGGLRRRAPAVRSIRPSFRLPGGFLPRLVGNAVPPVRRRRRPRGWGGGPRRAGAR